MNTSPSERGVSSASQTPGSATTAISTTYDDEADRRQERHLESRR